MGLVIKPKVAPATTPPVAAPAPAVDPVQTAVAAATETGADPYLAGIEAKTVPTEAPVAAPAPAPVKKGGLTIVKKPTAPAPTPAPAATPAEGKLKPGDEGFQAQVAAAFNMDTVVVNGVSTLVPKKPGTTTASAPVDTAPASGPFADNPVIAAGANSVIGIHYTAPVDAILQAEKDANYTILDAIKEMTEGRIGTLMLVNRESGLSYQVTGHNPKTGITTMLNSAKIKLHPILGEREVAQYLPVWR